MEKSIHDYKNQIILLEELASSNDIEKIKHYLLQEKELLSSKVFYIKTGNSAVDAIINTKIKIAEQKKIKFCVNAQINGFCGVDDFDLASILGNLIDNAIEASVTEEEPYIEIVIKIQKSWLNHRIRLISYQNWKYSQPTDDLGGNGKNIPK